MPLPGTRIIPAGWSQHHAVALPTSFNAAISVGVRTGTAYDAETDTTSATWSSDWAGGARVQRPERGAGRPGLRFHKLPRKRKIVDLSVSLSRLSCRPSFQAALAWSRWFMVHSTSPRWAAISGSALMP